MRIIHFGDIHYNEKDYQEIDKCMSFIIEKCIEGKPDVIICPGDIINSQYLGADTKSMKAVQTQFRELSDIAPIAVVAGTFSHDGLAPELLRSVAGKYPIWVSTKPEQIYLVRKNWVDQTDIQNLSDVLVDLVVTHIPPMTKEHWKNKQGIEKDNQNISKAMGSIFASFGEMAKGYKCPHILSGHFAMQGSMISEHQMLPGGDISIGKDMLAMANADLNCLSHIHRAQEYDLPNGKKAFHSGSIYRKNFGERNEDKGFYIHDLVSNLKMVRGEEDKKTRTVEYHAEGEGHTLTSEFVKTPTRHMTEHILDLIKAPWLLEEGHRPVHEEVADILSEWCRIGAWIKIKITIFMDDVRLINQSKLKSELLDAGAGHVKIEIDRVRRENSREDDIIRAVGLVDKVKALEKHRSQPAPDGVMEMLEQVEVLSPDDLVKYGVGRL